MSEKVYVGKGRKVGKFNQLKLGIKVSDLTPNDRGYCNILIGEMKSEDKYGNTHTAWIDDWKPTNKSVDEGTTEENPLPF